MPQEQAYSLGRKGTAGSGFAGALPFFQRAIPLDPNFAMAYGRGGPRSLEQLGVQFGAALALAGDAVQAQTLGKDLGKRFPEDTVVQFNYLPALHAQLALSHNDSSKAIEALQAAGPYELGNVVGEALAGCSRIALRTSSCACL